MGVRRAVPGILLGGLVLGSAVLAWLRAGPSVNPTPRGGLPQRDAIQDRSTNNTGDNSSVGDGKPDRDWTINAPVPLNQEEYARFEVGYDAAPFPGGPEPFGRDHAEVFYQKFKKYLDEKDDYALVGLLWRLCEARGLSPGWVTRDADVENLNRSLADLVSDEQASWKLRAIAGQALAFAFDAPEQLLRLLSVMGDATHAQRVISSKVAEGLKNMTSRMLISRRMDGREDFRLQYLGEIVQVSEQIILRFATSGGFTSAAASTLGWILSEFDDAGLRAKILQAYASFDETEKASLLFHLDPRKSQEFKQMILEGLASTSAAKLRDTALWSARKNLGDPELSAACERAYSTVSKDTKIRILLEVRSQLKDKEVDANTARRFATLASGEADSELKEIAAEILELAREQ